MVVSLGVNERVHSVFQTDAHDQDVIFVSEKAANKPREVVIDQEKRLALQRDIDLQSQPEHSVKLLATEKFAAVGIPTGGMKGEMEEKEKRLKKEKKRKKGQVSLPEETNGSVDAASQTEVKERKKKTKKGEVSIKEENENGELEEKKKKKRKTDSLIESNETDVNNGGEAALSKKKKKTERLADGVNEIENSEQVENSQKNKVKGKKHLKKEEEEEQSAEADSKSKKGKKSKNCVLSESTKETEVLIKEKKKKKKESVSAVEGLKETQKKAEVSDSEVKLETSEVEFQQVKKKKKKRESTPIVDEVVVTKKVKKIENGLKLETEETEIKEVKIEKKKKEEATQTTGKDQSNKTSNGSEVSGDKKLPKKKNKSTMMEMEEEAEQKKKVKQEKCQKASLEAVIVEETEKKKKRKKAKDEEEEQLVTCEDAEVLKQITGNHVTEAADMPRKKSKKKKSPPAEVEPVSNTGPKQKKKKIKEEPKDPQEASQTEVVFLSEKSGNTDEIDINQERRQALQMEIDKASQPRKPAKPAGFGQWGTAQFDSSEQQQKFLRLMGGFKKGFQPAASNTDGANMALGRDAQQQLQKGLLGDFERAHSRRMDVSNRAAGLGFSAPSNKKFSIDVDARRSVRFDD